MVNFKRDRSMFEEMRAAAMTRLISRSPLGIAEKTHIAFDEKRSEFRFDSLGTSVQVNYPEFQVSGGINDWHELVILHYLEMADGTSLSRRWITFGDLPQGFVRGGGFDQDCERLLGNAISRCKKLKLSASVWGPRLFRQKPILRLFSQSCRNIQLW